jgi:deoxyribonuclease-4
MMSPIGAHLGIGRGLKHTADEAVQFKLECLQIFLRNPRGSKARQLTAAEVDHFKEITTLNNIDPIVVHVSYVCNPAAAEPGLYELAHAIIAEDLQRCTLIGAEYLVMHPGSYTSSSSQQGIERVAQLLNKVLDNNQGEVTILLETMSGQGTELGRDFSELAEIIKRINRTDRIGVCYDTCHTYAAGYDCSSRTGLDAVLSEIDHSLGREHIRLVHANDCQSALGSHRDRHAHIGAGSIGLNGFAQIFADPFWATLPMIVETPAAGLGQDIERLKKLRQQNWRG